MKLDLERWLMLFVFLGLLGVGILLFTSHWGIAIKTVNYLFIVIILGTIYEVIFFKK